MTYTGEPLAEDCPVMNVIAAIWPKPPVTEARMMVRLDRLSEEERQLLMLSVDGMAATREPKRIVAPKLRTEARLSGAGSQARTQETLVPQVPNHATSCQAEYRRQ